MLKNCVFVCCRALSVSWEASVGESLGKLYLNTDRLQEAFDTFRAVLERYPERVSTRVYMVSKTLPLLYFFMHSR